MSKPSSARRGSCVSTPLRPPKLAREQLVPGAEAGALAVDLDRQRACEAARAVALGVRLDGREQLGAERGVVLGGLGRLGVLERVERVLDERLVSPCPWSGSSVSWSSTAPSRQLAGQVVLAARRSCARARRARCRRTSVQASIVVLPAADRVDRELARPAHAVDVLVDRVAARASRQLSSPGPR